MSNELISAIQQIAEEKNLSVESIVETIELALAAAYRKDFGNKQQNIKVKFDMETGSSDVFDIKEVVDNELAERYQKEQEEKEAHEADGEKLEVKESTSTSTDNESEEEEPHFNPKTMISLSEATSVKPNIKLGEELKVQLEVPNDYGRMAAQTAKQVIIQKIREAEREMTYDSFKEKEHQLVNGMIQRIEAKVILIDLENTTAIMPHNEQINGEFYHIGDRFKFYIKEVNQTPKGPEIVVSRSHPEIIRKLFMIEVPEISAGSVSIRSIAREAGSRSKIAVSAKEENIDPIGSCVGQRGARVQTIISELGGEKVDIIEYAENPAQFIGNSLSPAKIQRVEIDEEEHIGRAYVKTDQLSLAIGKGGQNVRLAAKLSGWRIDVIDEDSGETKENGNLNPIADQETSDKTQTPQELEDSQEVTTETENDISTVSEDTDTSKENKEIENK